MPAAARVTDLTNHPGAIGGPGALTVRIEQLPAARLGDLHICAFSPTPHPSNTIMRGSATVYIENMPAARLGDPCVCSATITTGAFTVSIGG